MSKIILCEICKQSEADRATLDCRLVCNDCERELNNADEPKGMAKALQFLSDSEALGYRLKSTGSVFKIDFNGQKYNVGFWLRPVGYDIKTQRYLLQGRCGKAKHEDFNTAVDMAIEAATRW